MNDIDSSMEMRFGWPKIKREEEFSRLDGARGEASYRIRVKGRQKTLTTHLVPIELPKYRLGNGRTVSLQEEYLAKNPEEPKNLFVDAEYFHAQEVQHNLLLGVARLANLEKVFDDSSNQQDQAILLDEYGFVVNGNRRLAYWRKLFYSDPEQYNHFSNIEVAILPRCEEKEIDRIEAKLQIEEDIKADYSWDAEANMFRAKMKQYEFTTDEISDLYGVPKKNVEQRLDMLAYATEYLNSIGCPNEWSKVSKSEFAFKKIADGRKKTLNDPDKMERFKELAFKVIQKPAEAADRLGGRLYGVIPQIMEHDDKIKGKILRELDVEKTKTEAGNLIFDSSILKAIQDPKNSDKTREIIIDVCESQRQIKRDSMAADYLLGCCSKVYDILDDAVEKGLHPEANLSGVSEKLDAIDDRIANIRTYLTEHVKN